MIDDEKHVEIKPKNNRNTASQMCLYLGFAVLMILLNMFIQNIHLKWIVPWIGENFGNWNLIQKYYLSTTPYNMPELVGSGIAVIITYITKFLLDKYIVFNSKGTDFKETQKQFVIYFLLALMTTAENIGIQFILGIITNWQLNLRIIIALSCGYITKFFLDRKYAFKNTTNNNKEK